MTMWAGWWIERARYVLGHLSYRQVRRLAVLVVGASVVLVGLAMVVLPGPAVVVIPVGLAILGLEFEWARRLLRRARDGIDAVRNNRKGKPGNASGGGSTTPERPAPGPANRDG